MQSDKGSLSIDQVSHYTFDQYQLGAPGCIKWVDTMDNNRYLTTTDNSCGEIFLDSKGRIGSCISLNDKDAPPSCLIEFGETAKIDFKTGFTIVFYGKHNAMLTEYPPGSNEVIWAKSPTLDSTKGAFLNIYEGQWFFCGINNESVYLTDTVRDIDWHFYALSLQLEGETYSLCWFIDGMLIKVIPIISLPQANDSPQSIFGLANMSTPKALLFSLDELRVYTRGLYQKEIELLASGPPAVTSVLDISPLQPISNAMICEPAKLSVPTTPKLIFKKRLHED